MPPARRCHVSMASRVAGLLAGGLLITSEVPPARQITTSIQSDRVSSKSTLFSKRAVQGFSGSGSMTSFSQLLPSGREGEDALRHGVAARKVDTFTVSVCKPERERLQTPAAATALFGKRKWPPFALRSSVFSSAISSTGGHAGRQPWTGARFRLSGIRS